MNIQRQQQWLRCLDMFRQRTDPHVFEVWFQCIVFRDYDESTHTLTLAVPSKYVFEYLEEVQVNLIFDVLAACFHANVELQYVVSGPSPAAPPAAPVVPPPAGKLFIAVPDAATRLRDAMRDAIGGREPAWRDGYDKIAAWLADNRGRGLFLVGHPGMGKSLLCRDVLPALLATVLPRVVTVGAREMNSRIDELLHERCVIIDDLGKEDAVVTTFGNHRTPFFELCDAAERNGNLLVVSTNLSTTPCRGYPSSVQERYGDAVCDRLRAITAFVRLDGESMRK